MKSFEVPIIYRSTLLSSVKNARKASDKLKKDFSPTCLDFGAIQFYIARHFGFCYGVENAIEIAFKTVQENPGKRIFLLSEMIHNPQVNQDLHLSGVHFIMDTHGNQLIPWAEITSDDVVIIPAFGTTLETEALLKSKGIDPLQYNTTCPFVERVWKKAEQIAQDNYTVVIHGKPSHEETKATFSHSSSNTPSIIIKDLEEAKLLGKYIMGQLPAEQFYIDFANRYSAGFDVNIHLQKIGVVNQTTMLAEDTQEIAEYIKQIILAHFENTNMDTKTRFADTRDTLCYATNDNQSAVKGMLLQAADLAIVVGGYNSSNTSHLVELCEEKMPTYFIKSAENLIDKNTIDHHHFRTHTNEVISDYLPNQTPLKVLITSGASCPDAVVESVMDKLLSFYTFTKTKEEVMAEFM
jgi:4-hydroxy-3-methylbut-2-en-1-yl diphosphate reductase